MSDQTSKKEYNGLLAPCEVIIWEVLPRVRAQLTKDLVDLEVPRKEVAKQLGVTQAAVSQYLSDKRGQGGGEMLGEEPNREIRELAEEIAAGEVDKLIPRICEICAAVRKAGDLCQLHRDGQAIPEECSLCFVDNKKDGSGDDRDE